MDNNAGSKKSRGVLRQYLATVIVNLSTLSYGMVLGWTSPTQALLQSNESPLGPLSDEEFSWLNSLILVGGLFGPLFWGHVIDRYGHKKTGYAIGAHLVVGWALIALWTSPLLNYVARFLMGVGGSCVFILCPIYVTEIAEDEVRGTLNSYVNLLFNGGIVLVYLLGACLEYYPLIYSCLAVTILFIVCFYFMPESPEYLRCVGREEEGERVLQWLRGGDPEVARREAARNAGMSQDRGCTTYKSLVKTKGNRRAMVIGHGLFAGQQYCGIVVILTYTAAIFEAAGGSLGGDASAIVIGLIQVVASYLSTLIVERTGRKILLLISFGVMGLCLASLGIYFHLLERHYDLSSFGFIPLASLCIYIFIYAVGAGPVPFAVVPEVMAPDIRALATSSFIFSATIFAFTSVKLYTVLTSAFGNEGCFWFFGFFCAFFFGFTWFLVPETKGRSLEDVLAELNREPNPKEELLLESNNITMIENK